jgi:hypothetical protein
LSPRKKKSRPLQRQSRGKENWGSAINLNGIHEALLDRSGVAQRQRESFPSKPALELEAKRLTPQPKTTAMCSRGGEMITAGSGFDPFGNSYMIHCGELSLAGGAAMTTSTNNDAADAVLLPSDEDATYTTPQTNLKRHHLLPSEPATKEEVMDFDEDCSSETEFEEKEDEVIDRGSLVGHQNDGRDRDSLVTYAISPLSSPSSLDDIEGGVLFLSPSDIIYYLDREHSDEGLGVFRLFQPEMKTENLELWIYSKITDLTSMATSNSEGGVLQDLVVVDEVEQNHSDLDDQFVEGLLRLQ